MKRAYIIGTCDTKRAEILYARQILARRELPTLIVDIGVFDSDLSPEYGDVIRLRERRPDVFRNIKDRGNALAVMGTLLEEFLSLTQGDIAGVIGLGGSGNTAVVTRGMRVLPIGMPKLMVSTVASGDIAPYVGATDICMMPSVADVQGINVITRKILGNAANALAGMALNPIQNAPNAKKLVGLSMFGVTTQAVQIVDLLSV